jgi:hypothetical protein
MYVGHCMIDFKGHFIKLAKKLDTKDDKIMTTKMTIFEEENQIFRHCCLFFLVVTDCMMDH